MDHLVAYIAIVLFLGVIILIYAFLKTSSKLEVITAEKIKFEQQLALEQTKTEIEKINLEERRTNLEKDRLILERDLKKLENDSQTFNEEKSNFEARKERAEMNLNEKENKIDQEKDRLDTVKESLEHQKEELKTKIELVELEQEKKLLEISNLGENEAKNVLFENLIMRNERDYAQIIKDYKSKIQLEKKEISREILLNAMENIAVDTTNETVVKAIEIPSEDIKGRLIGREGRNIKSLENVLGANIIIDDTPGQISISTFNPIRRIIGTKVLENLIATGKINQVSIEEEAEKVKLEIKEIILEKGKEAIYQFNIQDMDINLVKRIGQLYFRSSYCQNVLAHSIEAAKIAQKLANELELNPMIAARALLLHDIGKLDSQETGKSHVELGVITANNFGEDPIIINAIEAHHGDVEPTNMYSIITIIADKMSAGRTGGRHDNFESFIDRVETIEAIATSEKGVEKAYALQGGREVRVIVQSKDVSDNRLEIIADNIKKRIEKEIIFPGIIKVNVIREVRFVSEASKENIYN